MTPENRKQLIVFRQMLDEIWGCTDNGSRAARVEGLMIRLEGWIGENLGDN